MSTQLEDSAAAGDVEAGSRSKSMEPETVEFESDEKSNITPPYKQDAFGDEEFAEVKYKVLKRWYALQVNMLSDSVLLTDLVY